MCDVRTETLVRNNSIHDAESSKSEGWWGRRRYLKVKGAKSYPPQFGALKRLYATDALSFLSGALLQSATSTTTKLKLRSNDSLKSRDCSYVNMADVEMGKEF